MATIDERIVSMAFENAKFEAGVAQTMRTLSKLDISLQQIGAKNSIQDIEKAANKVTLQQPMSALDKLKSRLFGAGSGAAEGLGDIEKAGNKVQLAQPIEALDKVQAKSAQVGAGAAEGFAQIESASSRVTLDGLSSAMDSVTAKFSVLQGAASVALGNITSQAAMKGGAFAKSLSLGPITQGFQEYQTNLGSIQTILSNTKASGADLGDVNKALQELNRYSDQTIYNFSQMANSIGLFTAAGVDLKTSVASIKGIANLAALSGSDNEKAVHAQQQLAQAISSGKVGLMDWKSVETAGMGGAVFQRALATTADAMGTLKDGALKLEGPMKNVKINGESFRNSIMAKPGQESWLTSKVLTTTLAGMTGDMTDAQLAARGFNDEQIKSVQETAKAAKLAATQVKTLPQVFDVAKETIGSGWATTFQTIFGGFNEAKKTFTDLSNTINGLINKSSNARNKILGDWKALGGRTALIEGVKNTFKALFDILKPIGRAFRDIFPAQTGKSLYDLTKRFQEFTAGLRPGAATIDGIKRTARGFFAVLHIGWSIVKGVIGVIGDLLGVVGKGSGGFLGFTGSVGDFLVAVDNALTKGGLLKSFFNGISSVLKVPLQLLSSLSSAIFGLFGGIDTSKADGLTSSMGKVKGAAGPLAQALHGLKGAWDKLVHIFSQAKDMVSPWLYNIGGQLSSFGDTIGKAFEGGNFDKIMSTLQTGFIGGIFLALKKAISGGASDLTAPLRSLSGVLDGLTGSLKTMQQHVKAQIILIIASAIGVLAASVFLLSKVDAQGLTRAMTAISVGLGQLVGAMALLGKFFKGPMIVGMPIMAASMVMLAAAMVILGGAVKIFSTMSWDELAKGLVGVGGGLAAIGIGMKFLGPGTIVQGPAILVLSIALNALALAVKQFASMKWKDLGRGLGGVLGSLVAMIAPITAAGPGLTIAAPGVIGIAFALSMLAGAVRAFGEMDIKTLAIGLAGAAIGLVAIGGAMWAIPPHAALLGAGLVIVAVALNGVASAVKIFGGIGIVNLAKGLVALGFSLGIIAVGVTAMILAAPGAVALLAVAAALAVLAPTMAFLGTLKWMTIFKGLAAIALSLGVLAGVGALVAPGLVSLGVALLPLAGVFVLTAGAVFIFAKALALLGEGGTKGIAVMVTALTAFVALIPKLVIDFVKGLVDVASEMAKIAPQVVTALTKILDSLIQVVINSTPRLALALGILLDSFVMLLGQNAPKIIAAGFKLLLDFLSGLDKNLPQMIVRAGNIIVKFLEGLAAQAPRVITAGAQFLLAYISGMQAQIPALVNMVFNAITTFLTAVASRLHEVSAGGIRLAISWIQGIASQIGRVVEAGASIITSFLSGIANAIPRLVRSGLHVASKFLNGIADGLSGLADIGFRAIIRFLNGLEQAIRDNFDDLFKAGAGVADAIIDGLVGQFGKLGGVLRRALESVFQLLPGWAKGILGISSPSKVFMEIGALTMQGFVVGIEQGEHGAKKAIRDAAGNVVDTAKGAIGNTNLLDGLLNADPVISPVLDLSAVKKEAQKLDGLTNVSPLTPTVSIGQASAIAEEKAVVDATKLADATPVLKEVKFEQNNHSPESLSDVEIYRQTRNLLSAAKSELGLAS